MQVYEVDVWKDGVLVAKLRIRQEYVNEDASDYSVQSGFEDRTEIGIKQFALLEFPNKSTLGSLVAAACYAAKLGELDGPGPRHMARRFRRLGASFSRKEKNPMRDN